MEDTLDRCAALGAGGDGVVTHALHDLERVAFFAAVFVDRHAATKYVRGPGSYARRRLRRFAGFDLEVAG